MNQFRNHNPEGTDPESDGQGTDSPGRAPPGEAELPDTQPLGAAAPAAIPETAESELESARAQADEYLNGWQRARADFANYKKRIEREQAEARDRIAGETLTRFFGILDDLERALKDRPSGDEVAAWAEGIELIYRKLVALFLAEGVEEINAAVGPFDPALHEALSHEESDDHAEGQVIEVVRRGYRIGDRVLRPALVRVAK